MAGLTFDTGALIGLERKHHHMRKVFHTAVTRGIPITVPVVVISEWWRGSGNQDAILRMLRVEEMTTPLAKLSGIALSKVGKVGVADAIVMASAARRGDIVYTSDVDDLMRLSTTFPSVRIFAA